VSDGFDERPPTPVGPRPRGGRRRSDLLELSPEEFDALSEVEQWSGKFDAWYRGQHARIVGELRWLRRAFLGTLALLAALVLKQLLEGRNP